MKKMIVLVTLIIFISACVVKEKNIGEIKEKQFVLEKVDHQKDYVYLSEYKDMFYNNEEYILNNLIINIKSEDVDNINLELKSFVIKSFKDMKIDNGNLKNGNIINYDYYVNNDVISVIQRYFPYIDGVIGEEDCNVYVVSLDTGKSLSNEEILEKYKYDEEELLELIENKSNSDDIAFTIMNIKNNGYKLYINADNKLCIIFNEVDDNQSIRKELVLN